MKRIKTGIVWIEASKGTFHPMRFSVSGNGTTEDELRRMIRKDLPSCGLIIFQKEKPCPKK